MPVRPPISVCYFRRAGRFVRAAGAVKALRAKTFRGERGGISLAALRLAKSLSSRINGWDANRDGKSEEGSWVKWGRTR